MICIYDKKTTKGNFETNGLGVLDEVISCFITEELNGDYELELEYPSNSRKTKYLKEWNIIKADGQLFRIYIVIKEKKENKVVKIFAKHIFYDLRYFFIEDQRAVQCSIKTAIEKALVDDLSSTFSADSDILINNTLYMVEINPAEAIFKIIERWGIGELYRDNFNIKILKEIGSETGVLIKYGKNIKGLKVTYDITNLATRIYPKGANGIVLTERYVTVPKFNNSNYPPFHIVKKVEFKDAQDEPTLRIMAQEYAKIMGFTNVNIEVDFIELRRTKEYERYSELERVRVGDFVIVRCEDFAIDVVVEVIKIKQDMLTGYNTKVELGQPKVRGKNEYVTMINTVRDELGNKVAEALSSMLYYANPKELMITAVEVQPIYLGITAVANTNLNVNIALSCNSSTNCILTIRILLDGNEIPFKPKHKLQGGNNVVGIPLGIPQVPSGNHYISINLQVDSGSVSIPIYNLQCMIDGRNLQGGMSSEPPHAEVIEDVGIITPNNIITKVKSQVKNQVSINTVTKEEIPTYKELGITVSDNVDVHILDIGSSE